MRQHWRVIIGMKDERQYMPDQTIEIPAPRILTEGALAGIYAYLDLVYDGIYYFSLDYAGSPVNDRGRCEVFIENGKIDSVMYDEGYMFMCNKFDNANLQDRI